MNIAVCDDDKIILEMLQNMIINTIANTQLVTPKIKHTQNEEQNKELNTTNLKTEGLNANLSTFCTGEALLSAIKGTKYIPARQFDIIFLDIQMAGINGIEAAKAIRAVDDKAVLIFITAVKEYVFEAFDVAAFHDLVKPYEEQKFSEVFVRAVKEVQKHQKAAEEMLVVKSGKNSVTIQKNHIYYIENKAKKLVFHTDKKVLEIYAAMLPIEQELGAAFYRCHRGYLVNMAYIEAYSRDSITLANGETIYLAKEKYAAFVKTYMRYLRNGVHGSV